MADQHPQSRINSRLTVILAVLVILSALPLASNRAVWWQFWTLSISVTALIYFWRKDRLLRSFKPRFMHYHLAFLLALVVPAYALLQAAPIAGILPDGLWALRAGMEEMQGRAISVYPGVSATGAIRFMGYVILFALILEVTTRAQRVSLLAVLLFIGIVAQGVWALAALNMLGDYAPWGKEAYLGYATGTFVNRNSLAFYLGMGMILGVGILAHWSEQPQIRSPGKLTWFQRLGADGVFIFVGLAMLAVALIETGSRAGLASSCAGVLTTLTMIRLRAGTTWRRIVLEIAGLFLALLIGLALFTQGEGVAERLLFTGKEGASRMEIYRQVIDMISVRPLTGFGFDTFGPAFEAFRAPPLILDKYYDLAHNSYLGLWAELGLIVGSVPVLLLAYAGFRLLRLWRSEEEAGYPGIAAAAMGVLVLGAMHSLVDFSLEMPANVYLFVTILGLGLGVRRRSERSVSGNETSQSINSNFRKGQIAPLVSSRGVKPSDKGFKK